MARRMGAIGALVAIGLLSPGARAGESWSGTWRSSHGKEPASELRTIDRDGDVEFQLELSGRPPAYDAGLAHGHLTIRDGAATFEAEFEGRCRIDFSFTPKRVMIKQSVGNWADCGFGHSIIADGTFVRTSRRVPRFTKH